MPLIPRLKFSSQREGLKVLTHPMTVVATAATASTAIAISTAVYDYAPQAFTLYGEAVQYEAIQECQSSSAGVKVSSVEIQKNSSSKECDPRNKNESIPDLALRAVKVINLLDWEQTSGLEDWKQSFGVDQMQKTTGLNQLDSLIGPELVIGESYTTSLDVGNDECGLSFLSMSAPALSNNGFGRLYESPTIWGSPFAGAVSQQEYECLLYLSDLDQLEKISSILPIPVQPDGNTDDKISFVFPDNDNGPRPPLNPMIKLPGVSQDPQPDVVPDDKISFVFPDDEVLLIPINPVTNVPSDNDDDASIPEPGVLVGVGVLAGSLGRLRRKRRQK